MHIISLSSHESDLIVSDAVSMPFTDLPPKLLAQRRCTLCKGLARVERQAPHRRKRGSFNGENGGTLGKTEKNQEKLGKTWKK